MKVNSFSLDDEIIKSKTKTAIEKLDAVMRDLRKANSDALKAIKEVEKHSELNNI